MVTPLLRCRTRYSYLYSDASSSVHLLLYVSLLHFLCWLLSPRLWSSLVTARLIRVFRDWNEQAISLCISYSDHVRSIDTC